MALLNLSRRRLRLIFAASFFAALLGVGRSETSVDHCRLIHTNQGSLGTLAARSENLVVDTADNATYDGDASRFKRENDRRGYVLYTSTRGIEQLTAVVYAFEPLPSNSWSIGIRIGGAETNVEDMVEVLGVTQASREQYAIEGGQKKWRKFQIDVPMTGANCSRRVAIVLDGPASNNEYAGWGLQLAEVRIVQSWYEDCKRPCKFDRGACPNRDTDQFVDPLNDFQHIYDATPNIVTDRTDAGLYFGGDRGRLKRSNKRPGELLYVSTRTIRRVEVELYQFKPWNTELRLRPAATNSCEPIVLPPVLQPATKQPKGDWKKMIAYFDLRDLPLCTKRVTIELLGGDQGWELQISRVTFRMTGTLETNPETLAEPVRVESVDGNVRRYADDDGGGSKAARWWIWFIAFISAALVFVAIGMIVQRVSLCLGDDERSIYHISNLPFFGRKGRKDYREEVGSELPEAVSTNGNAFATMPGPSMRHP